MRITTDFLIIGSGIAGLMYALDVADYGAVTIICKREPTEGSTRYAQGGIATVTSPLDSFEEHVADTLDAGAGLCHEDIVRTVVQEGPERIQRLIEIGTKFDTADESGDFALGREGGHSQRRILHARDATGAELQRALLGRVLSHQHIQVRPEHTAIDLIYERDSSPRRVIGVYALNNLTGEVITIGARVVMIATGGAGKVYLYTSNPDIATGDGIAMAYRGGARISNMEFMQFHPTCLYHPDAKSFLLTEALRGEGAVLYNLSRKRFMSEYDPRLELAPRDIVARAIDDQMKRTGADYMLLDISHRDPEFVRSHFPTIHKRLLEYGYDLTTGPVPVVPAAHYTCGGILTDENARTDLFGLYAAGEAACTGLHGANRLASNSLLEALVFAHRAALDTAKHLADYPMPETIPPWDYMNTDKSSEEVLVSHSWDEVRRTMWNLVGIVRSDKRLQLAQRRLQLIEEEIKDYYWNYRIAPDLIELRNIIEISQLIVASAQWRRESRGLHYNVDCPHTDDANWKRDSVFCRGENGRPVAA